MPGIGPLPPHVTGIGPPIEVCETCEGRHAVLADLEDLGPRVHVRFCL